MSAAIRDRARFGTGLLFLLLVVIAYASPLFFRRNFGGRDLAVYNLPMEKAMHDAYARGRLPVWMPYVSGGRPLLPNPNAGAMYPVRPLLAVVPFPIAMRLAPVLHWIAAGLGMIFLLRTVGVSSSATWIGAVTYVFSGVGVSEVFFPNLHPGMAILPWIVWAVARPVVRAASRLVLLSLLFGLDFLAGDVFTIGMAIVAAVLWMVTETPRAARGKEVLLLGGSLALAGLLAAPQIVATALWVPETNRAVLGMKLRESLFFSVHPLRLLEFAIPFPFGSVWQQDSGAIWGWPIFQYKGMGMFLTLYAGAFALVALAVTRRVTAAGARFGRLLFLLALAVAVLPSLLPKRWENVSSPLPLRNPEKFSVAVVFALGILTAIALDRLRKDRLRPRWPLVVAAILSALALLARLAPEAAGRAAVTLSGDDRWLAAASREVWASLAEGAFLWVTTFVALDALARPSRAGAFAAVALLTFVPLAANRRIARTLSESDLFDPPRFVRLLGKLDPGNSYRTLGESLYSPPSQVEASARWGNEALSETRRRSWIRHAHALWERGTVFNDDFDVGDFSRLNSLRRLSVAAAAYEDSQPFFQSFSLRWGIRFRDQKPIAGYRRFGGDLLQDWDLLAGAAPDVRLAKSWIEKADPVAALAALPSLGHDELVLETGKEDRGESGGGIVHVLAKEPERLTVETVTSDPSWLFVLRGWWNSRTVRLDGRRVACFPAQVAFSAVPIPAGRHRVDWEEEVPGGRISRWGPVAYALVVLLLVLGSRVDRKPAAARQ